MKRLGLEFFVGLFIVVGIGCLAYLSIRLGKMEIIGNSGYRVYAEFSNVGGLKAGSAVEIAGVEIGRVKTISLDDYQAKVEILVHPGVTLQDDAIAAIRTKGLIGEKFIEITPGGSEKVIPKGGRIRDTQPPIDLEKALGSFIFGKV